MRTIRIIAIAAAVAALAAAQAQAQILVKATVKATTSSASGGKIVKKTTSNVNIVSDCTSTPGAQLVGVFDTNSLSVVELDVVDPCGAVLCQVATFSSEGDCADTGASSTGKREIICPVSMTVSNGGQGFLVSDVKLTFGSSGDVKSGSLKASGVFIDGSGDPGTISISAGAGFKPASNCPH